MEEARVSFRAICKSCFSLLPGSICIEVGLDGITDGYLQWPSAPALWLIRCGRNAMIDYMRREKRKKSLLFEPPYDERGFSEIEIADWVESLRPTNPVGHRWVLSVIAEPRYSACNRDHGLSQSVRTRGATVIKRRIRGDLGDR